MVWHRDMIRAAAPLVKAYHRLGVHGLDNLPPPGQGFLLAPNHTHWFGYDALVINTAARDRDIRWVAWSYADEFPLWDKMVRAFNGILAGHGEPFPYEDITAQLKSGGVVGIFPEGNNNSVATPYRVRPFFPGVVRLAALAGVPVVPVSVAGVEEAGPVLWMKEEEGRPPTWVLPAPVLLPARITVRFGAPLSVTLDEKELLDADTLLREADRIRDRVLDLLQQDRTRAWAQPRLPRVT